jgi:hypothetical protein
VICINPNLPNWLRSNMFKANDLLCRCLMFVRRLLIPHAYSRTFKNLQCSLGRFILETLFSIFENDLIRKSNTFNQQSATTHSTHCVLITSKLYHHQIFIECLSQLVCWLLFILRHPDNIHYKQ